MGLNALTQSERLQLVFFDRVYLVHLELPGKTLYLSDRNYKYNYGTIQNYENYLFDLPSLVVDLNRIRPGLNQKLTLRFRNEKILSVNTMIELNSTYRFCFATVRIYELRVVEQDETFASDVKQLVFRGVCGQPYGITRREFKIDCSNVLLAKRARLPLQLVDTSVDPNADPDDVGKIRNTAYGTVGHVPCACVIAGAKDSLTANVTSSATIITVSGDTKISFPASGTIQIDAEQITYTGFSSNQFTGCTRGVNGTSAVAHNKGSAACQVLSQYIYEIAKHPVKNISAVYVDGVLQTSGVTAYTGQPGDELTGYSGRAAIKFTVLPVIRKQINITVTATSFGMNEGSHGHSGTEEIILWKFDSASQLVANVIYPESLVDGNLSTYAFFQNAGAQALVTKSFYEDFGVGTISQLRPCLRTGAWNPGALAVFSFLGGAAVVSTNVADYTVKGNWINLSSYYDSWAELNATPGYVWKNNAGSSTDRIAEVWCEIKFTPVVNANAATGVTLTGTATPVGNSSADTVIGDLVTADIQGYQDDGSGTYTGTPNALIERPDHVLKHILIAVLGESASDIGSNFAASGTNYGSTYKLAFIIHEIAKEADRLFQELAFQCRSTFLEFRGKFELIYMGSAPSPALTFTDDELLEEPVFGYTPEVDIRNRIYAKYKRDYRRSGREAYDGIESTSDATSITNNGERVEEIELSACRTQAMAQDWVAWYLTHKKQEWRTLGLTLPWIGKVLGAGDTLGLIWLFYTGLIWDLESIDVDHSRERMTIKAQEWPS